MTRADESGCGSEPHEQEARRRRVRGGPDRPLTSIVDRYAWLSAVRADVAAIRRLAKEATPPDQRLTADAVIVASAIADRVSSKKGYAFPRLSALADMTGLKERGLRGIVDQLVARGHLHVKVSRGPGASNRYWILRQGGGGADVDDEPEPDENRHEGAGNNRHGGAGIQGENRHDRAGKYRHGDDAKTGMAVPPNAVNNAVDSNAAAPPPVGGGGRTAVRKETAVRPASSSSIGLFPDPAEFAEAATARTSDGVSDLEDFPEQPAMAAQRAARRRREAAWRAKLVTEPVITDADASALHDLVDGGTVNEADVLQGIDDALRRPDFRPKRWHSLCGWVKGAAQRRLAATPRDLVPVDASVGRPADAIRVPGGGFRTPAQFAEQRRRWDDGFTWDELAFGDPPDSEFTVVPEDLRGPRKRLAAAGRPLEHEEQ